MNLVEHFKMFSMKVIFVLFMTFVICSADFYSFSVEDNQGESVSLDEYRGKVTLVVNVASLCGYTDVTYRALSKIHDILGYEGYFSVLAFPCNQFGDQEPEDAETICNVMKKEYGVEFPIFNKIDVVGEKASPAFRNLVEQSSRVPEWNFYKYLVDSDGEVLNSWGTRTELEEIFPEVQAAVEKAKLAGKAKETPKVNEEETKTEDPESSTKEEL